MVSLLFTAHSEYSVLLDEPSSRASRASAIESHLNPPPEDYGRSIFADKCTIQVKAGSGGHGCISFLREKFIAEGPANGGDGGTGGNVYIQAVKGETSLHKLARRGALRATRGKNGQGKSKGGSKGEDILIKVPVGTVIREISRHDPVGEEEEDKKQFEGLIDSDESPGRGQFRRDKWILYPSAVPSDYNDVAFPTLPRARRSNLAALQPRAPVCLDLSETMEKPMLLAAGAVGGFGNPHFVSRETPRPKIASKGEVGMSLKLELELKLLADVGFVGLPNAGKSTLLRALSRSRARVGDWAFTTLQPNIGTVVLDNARGRPRHQAFGPDGEVLTQFTIADVPGLVPDAHLDRGMGLDFLRHIERARVLAFVIDLSTGDAVETIKVLWKELVEYQKVKDREMYARSEGRKKLIDWSPYSDTSAEPEDASLQTETPGSRLGSTTATPLPLLQTSPISTKPWLIVATKADLDGTKDNFKLLQAYLEMLNQGTKEHPGEIKNAWKGRVNVVPISAIRGEGVEGIPTQVISLISSN
ncbi:GTPase of the mitochondrial inner membrane that associates with the large ribosomal subunit [Agyrium rufum]|nr:GTPase of the mitochondrial inner membrane that associates with the large ribosomal subunit [Agyrium rufum]